MSEPKTTSRIRGNRLILLTLSPVITMIAALFVPWNLTGLSSHPDPVQNYAGAVQRIEALQAHEASLNPVCRTQFMTHGQKAQRVIVFVHGYTNCPQQFAELGKRFYGLGYNVLMVPVPHHGLIDRLTGEQALLKAEELAAYTDQVVDIAQGLGEQVVIGGLSLGGVVAAWAAQNRSDVNLAVIISPGFGFKQIPTPLTVPIANYFLMAPVSFDWWDPKLMENLKPDYAYPRYSRRVLGEIMRFGFSIRAGAQTTAPAAAAILVVNNENEPSVNNELTAQIIQEWRNHGATLSTYEFEKELALGHDLIDPNDQDANIDLVYSRLVELIDK